MLAPLGRIVMSTQRPVRTGPPNVVFQSPVVAISSDFGRMCCWLVDTHVGVKELHPCSLGCGKVKRQALNLVKFKGGCLWFGLSPCPGCNRHHQDDMIFLGSGIPT